MKDNIDNIIFRKIWQDDDVMELTVECSSPLITATSEIYVSDSLIDELISKLRDFSMGIKKDFGQTKKEEMLLQRAYLFASFEKMRWDISQ